MTQHDLVLTIIWVVGIVAISGAVLWLAAHIGDRPKPTKAHPDFSSDMPLMKNLEFAQGNFLYKTEGSTVISSRKWGTIGVRHEEYLMRTPRGNFFEQNHIMYRDGDRTDYIYPKAREDAIRIYHNAKVKRMSFEKAFGEKLLDA